MGLFEAPRRRSWAWAPPVVSGGLKNEFHRTGKAVPMRREQLRDSKGNRHVRSVVAACVHIAVMDRGIGTSAGSFNCGSASISARSATQPSRVVRLRKRPTTAFQFACKEYEVRRSCTDCAGSFMFFIAWLGDAMEGPAYIDQPVLQGAGFGKYGVQHIAHVRFLSWRDCHRFCAKLSVYGENSASKARTAGPVIFIFSFCISISSAPPGI